MNRGYARGGEERRKVAIVPTSAPGPVFSRIVSIGVLPCATSPPLPFDRFGANPTGHMYWRMRATVNRQTPSLSRRLEASLYLDNKGLFLWYRYRNCRKWEMKARKKPTTNNNNNNRHTHTHRKKDIIKGTTTHGTRPPAPAPAPAPCPQPMARHQIPHRPTLPPQPITPLPKRMHHSSSSSLLRPPRLRIRQDRGRALLCHAENFLRHLLALAALCVCVCVCVCVCRVCVCRGGGS
jgi:hypothetical protein